MTCLVVGLPGSAAQVGLSEDDLIAPSDFGTSLKYATGAIILSMRHLLDRDVELLNHIPTMIVLSTDVDITHLEMHLRDGRFLPTPFDGFVLPKALNAHRHRALWIASMERPAKDLKAFAKSPRALVTTRALPAGMDEVPKGCWISLARKMRIQTLTSVAPTLSAAPSVETLLGCCFSLTDIIFAQADNLPTDVIFAAPDTLESSLDAYPEARLFCCPALISPDQSLEMIHRRVGLTRQVPMHMCDAVLAERVTGHGALACLTFEIG